jgi:hypothetical protein
MSTSSRNEPQIALRYQAIRSRLSELLLEIRRSVLPEEMIATAKRLGFMYRGAFIAMDDLASTSVEETAVFCYRRGGETAIARAYRTLPEDAPALDRTIFQGLQSTRWSVFDIVRIRPDEGAELRDTADGANYSVWDVGLSRAMLAGQRMTARIFAVDGIWMTSGVAMAGIEAPLAALAQRYLPVELHDPAAWPPTGSSERDRIIVTLQSHLMGTAVPSPGTAGPSLKGPCPCGSGKKYKHCCGKER